VWRAEAEDLIQYMVTYPPLPFFIARPAYTVDRHPYHKLMHSAMYLLFHNNLNPNMLFYSFLSHKTQQKVIFYQVEATESGTQAIGEIWHQS
jgi:hypothetical protein